MEVGAKVMAEERTTMNRKHIVTAYMTFVTLDDHGKPTKVPHVSPKSDVEKRRYEDAAKRRESRLGFKKTPKKGSQ